MKVLVLEDSLADQEVLRTRVEGSGDIDIDLIFVESVHAVSDSILNSTSLIVTDLNLGTTNGLETLDALRERMGDNQVPIIVLSDADEDELDVIGHGAADFIPKAKAFTQVPVDTLIGILWRTYIRSANTEVTRLRHLLKTALIRG